MLEEAEVVAIPTVVVVAIMVVMVATQVARAVQV